MEHYPGDKTAGSIEWQLHSSKVSDLELSEALAAKFYQRLVLFGLHLTGSRVEADAAASQAIVEATANRHRFWNETSLKAWLYKLALHRLASQLENRRSSGSFFRRLIPRSKKIALDSFHLHLPDGSNDWLAGEMAVEAFSELYISEGVPFILYYGHTLSTDEIAYILRSEAASARTSLRRACKILYQGAYPGTQTAPLHTSYIEKIHILSEKKLEPDEHAVLDHHLEGCEACRLYALRLPGLEIEWSRLLSPESPVSIEGQQPALGDILERVSVLASRRTRLALPVKEFALIAAVTALITFFGLTAGVLDTFDARPTITPLPTVSSTGTWPSPTPLPITSPPEELSGQEGADYFIFRVWVNNRSRVFDLAESLGLSEDAVLYLNPYLSDHLHMGQEIILAGWRHAPIFNPALSISANPEPPPLDRSSSVAEVLDRIASTQNYWDSVLLEQVYLNFGPPGYSGPPLEYRYFGGNFYPPDHAVIFNEYTGYRIILIQAGEWLFYNMAEEHQYVGDRNKGFDASSLFILDQAIMERGQYQITGLDEIAGREAIILDWTNDRDRRLQRIWADTVNGLFLRIAAYSEEDDDILTQLYTTLAVEFSPEQKENPFFPPNTDLDQIRKSFPDISIERQAEITAELHRHYASRRMVLDKQPPPPDFEPAEAPLTLQWPEPAQADHSDRENDQPHYLVDVFTDGYFLGSLDIGNLVFKSCYRSADGKMAAIHTVNDQVPFYWFSLDTLELRVPSPLDPNHMVDNHLGEYLLADLAFSHDNRYLAAAGCLPECGLYLVELDTGEAKLLRSTGRSGSPNHILWNSEGDQIAYTLADHFARTLLVINVVDVKTGDLTYAGRLNQTTYEFLPPGSPTITWGAAYPPLPEENLGPEGFTPPGKGCMLPLR
jgi:DNA-directed RNA polymerase specialized sigma24 family protein